MNPFRFESLAAAAVMATVVTTTPLPAQHRGIVGQAAPELKVDAWDRLPKKTNQFKLADQRGKVVLLYCFQAHCPGCRASGFPRVKKLYAKYKDDSHVRFVAVQTTFGSDRFAQAKQVMDQFGLNKVPVAQDEAKDGLPQTARDYKTGGTPWMVIIDKKGRVRANDFHIEVDKAIDWIERLKKE